jgi:3-oxoadipate enol-lactonase
MKPLELPNGELFYEEKGVGLPVLFLHAGIADSRMWEGQFAHFAKHYRAVRCDLRGYGRSPIPDGPYSHSEDVLALVEALGLAPAYLVGASFGAKVAVDFYLAYPERVRGLVLVAPVVSGWEPSGELAEFFRQEEELLEDGELEAATELNLRMWVDGPYRTSEAVNPTLRKSVGEMQYQAFSQPVPENASSLEPGPPAIDRLEEIRVPLLVISGDLDAPAFVEFSKTMAKRVRGAKRVVIPDTAHLVNMEAPVAFNQVVLKFISSLQNDR